MNQRRLFFGMLVLALWLVGANWYYSYYIIEEDNASLSIDLKNQPKPLQPKKKKVTAEPNREQNKPVNTGEIHLDYRVTIFKNKGAISLGKEDLDKMVKHLNTNLDDKLVAVVFSGPMEKDSIRIQRAENLKTRFIARDIDKRRLETTFFKDSSLFDKGTSFDKGIKLMYRRMSDEKIRELEKSIEHTNVYVYYISDSIVVTKKALKYFESLKAYLTKYPNKNIYLIGHTDSIGKLDENQWRGLRRAKITAQYLLENKNIPKEKIITMSKGEEEPLASNGTEEGRKINRRVEVIIK